ncbi:MAG: DUF5011 domain-containing protein [Bacteroidia bacterium]|nr:DUF5011 domain-containing protein [Bacteroidia bacterium]
MKNSHVLFLAGAVLLSTIFFTGCKKEDTTLPIIELKGSNPMLIVLNSSISDPGASAKDDKDGELVVTSDWSLSSTPNVNYSGTYTVTYTAIDKSDNKATKSRVVIVRNDAYFLEGTYSCLEPPSSTQWTQTISASKTDNNRIIFSKFANISGNNAIYADISALVQVDIPTPESGRGPSSCLHTYSPDGMGNPIDTIAGHINFSIKFTDEETTVDVNCPGTIPVSKEDFFVKQ